MIQTRRKLNSSDIGSSAQTLSELEKYKVKQRDAAYPSEWQNIKTGGKCQEAWSQELSFLPGRRVNWRNHSEKLSGGTR